MEYRKKCNVCNKVWCYTDKDIKENTQNAAVGLISSLGAMASVIGGTRYDAYELNKVSNNSTNKIKDFSRCPYCNSTDIAELSDREFEKLQKNISGGAYAAINSNASVESLIKRIELFMEDNEWNDAEAYCNQALDIEPENGYLWLLKMLIDYRWKFVDNKVVFGSKVCKLEESSFYNKVERFSKQNEDLQDKIKYIKDEIYDFYYKEGERSYNTADYEIAVVYFKYIIEYKDSKEYIEKCENAMAKIIENSERELANKKYKSDKIEELEEAREIFKRYKDNWDDASENIKNIDEKIERIEEKRVRKVQIIVVAVILIFILIKVSNSVKTSIDNKETYDFGCELLEYEEYEKARGVFVSLGNYKDCSEKIRIIDEKINAIELENRYARAQKQFDSDDFYYAAENFKELGDYKDSAEKSLLATTLYNIKYIHKAGQQTYFIENKDKFELISDDVMLKNILTGSWNRKIRRDSWYYSSPDSVDLKSDGSGIYNEFEGNYSSRTYNKYDIKWDVSDGYIYIKSKNNKYIGFDDYKKEVRKISDGVFLLINKPEDEQTKEYVDSIFIKEDCEYANYLKT